MKLIPVVSIFIILSVVNGTAVYGVFTSLVSLIYQGTATVLTPSSASWMVTLDWTLNGATVQSGDTFSLNMPCVFKFTSTVTTFDLEVDSIPYATCNMASGELVLPYSEIDCTVLSTIRSTTEYSGQITIPLTFNVGGSDNANNLLCASKFSNGIGSVINNVTFSDGQNYLSSTANFAPGTSSSYDPNYMAYLARIVPTLNQDENYLVTGQCLDGYDSVTLGFNITNGLDCNTAAQALTTQLNAWYLPMTSFDTSFNYTCSNVSFIAEFTNISAGYRPYVSVLASPKVGQLFRVTYINVYRCAGTSTALNRSKSVSWGVYTNPNTSGTNGTAAEVIVVTSIWAQSTTGVTTLPYTSAGTKTIVVQIPTPSTTITSTWEESFTTTSTLSYVEGGTKTIVVEVPFPVITITNTIDGSDPSTTTTLPYTSGGTKTVIVDVPFPATTITNTIDGSVTSTTSTQPYTSGGTKTVIIDIPYPVTTITNTIDGSVASTTSTEPYTSDGTKTVIIDISFPATTITNTIDGSVTSTTSTQPYTSGGTKTVIIDVSFPATTITNTIDGSVTSTTSTEPYTSGGTKTVIIDVPYPATTITNTIDGSVASTTSTQPYTSGGMKTVIVDVPFPATTIINTWEFSTTMVSTLPYTNGGTKTVIVDVPTPIVTVTRYWDQSVTSFSTFPFTTGGTITVDVFVPPSNTLSLTSISMSISPDESTSSVQPSTVIEPTGAQPTSSSGFLSTQSPMSIPSHSDSSVSESISSVQSSTVIEPTGAQPTSSSGFLSTQSPMSIPSHIDSSVTVSFVAQNSTDESSITTPSDIGSSPMKQSTIPPMLTSAPLSVSTSEGMDSHIVLSTSRISFNSISLNSGQQPPKFWNSSINSIISRQTYISSTGQTSIVSENIHKTTSSAINIHPTSEPIENVSNKPKDASASEFSEVIESKNQFESTISSQSNTKTTHTDPQLHITPFQIGSTTIPTIIAASQNTNASPVAQQSDPIFQGKAVSNKIVCRSLFVVIVLYFVV